MRTIIYDAIMALNTRLIMAETANPTQFGKQKNSLYIDATAFYRPRA